MKSGQNRDKIETKSGRNWDENKTEINKTSNVKQHQEKKMPKNIVANFANEVGHLISELSRK